jgi:hypothetical protein
MNKIQLLKTEIMASKLDVVMITETWASPDNSSDALFSFGSTYSVFRSDRIAHRGGGVMLLTQCSIKAREIELKSLIPGCDVLCVDIVAEIGYRIIICYRPPGYVSIGDTILLFELVRDLSNDTTKTVLVIGDFNLPGADWDLHTGCYEECFLAIQSAALTQLIVGSTMIDSENRNDLLFVNDVENVVNVSNGCPLGASDHRSVNFEICNVVSSCTNSSDIPTRNFMTCDYEAILDVLSTLNWDDLYESTDSNVAYEIFINKLSSVISTFCPTMMLKKRRV